MIDSFQKGTSQYLGYLTSASRVLRVKTKKIRSLIIQDFLDLLRTQRAAAQKIFSIEQAF